MADSMRDVQRSIKNRYGSTNMFKVMFVDRKVVHSMCQMMFGVDTDFSFDALLELGAEMPVDPIVIPQGGERRFISYDANTGFTTHQYELPLIIVPGGDMNYRVKLICSNDYSCDPYDGYPKDGRCDCADDGVKCTRDPKQ